MSLNDTDTRETQKSQTKMESVPQVGHWKRKTSTSRMTSKSG